MKPKKRGHKSFNKKLAEGIPILDLPPGIKGRQSSYNKGGIPCACVEFWVEGSEKVYTTEIAGTNKNFNPLIVIIDFAEAIKTIFQSVYAPRIIKDNNPEAFHVAVSLLEDLEKKEQNH